MAVLIFIDLTSANDTLPKKLTFRILTLRLGLDHFVELLRAIYTNTTAVIEGSTRSFKIGRGRRQGGLKSPWIFNMVFDTACRVIHKKTNTQTNKQKNKKKNKLISELGHGLIWNIIYQFKSQTGLKVASCEVGDTQNYTGYVCRRPVRVFHFC